MQLPAISSFANVAHHSEKGGMPVLPDHLQLRHPAHLSKPHTHGWTAQETHARSGPALQTYTQASQQMRLGVQGALLYSVAMQAMCTGADGGA